MEYAALFFFLILALFLLSRLLTSEIFNFLFKISKNESFAISVLAFVFFAGVFVHEISHYMAAKFMFVRTGKVSFLPKKEGNYVKLGSVSVAESNFVKEFIIALAPLIVGTSLILFCVYFMLQDFYGLNFLKITASLLIIFLVSNTMYTSRRDLQAALPFLVFIITLGIILIIVNFRFPIVTFSNFPAVDLSRIFYMGSIYLGVPIIIDLIIILIFRFFDSMW